MKHRRSQRSNLGFVSPLAMAGSKGGKRETVTTHVTQVAFTLIELLVAKSDEAMRNSAGWTKAKARKARAGFTLIELLVVIAIIGILAGLLTPSLSMAQKKAKRVACVSNLKQIGVMFQMYVGDSGGVMPCAASLPSANLNNDPRICDVLTPYTDGNGAFQCPADTRRAYFKTEGSSYAYMTLLGGRRVEDSFMSKRFGESYTTVMHDYEAFHGEPGTSGAMNYLFADGHAGDLTTE